MDLQSTIINQQSSIINHEGFTLIEVIVFIVVAGVIAAGIFIPFMTILKGSTTPEKVATATYLAQYKMEELTKNAYALLAPAPTLTTYAPAGISGYQWQWQISYVNANLAILIPPSDVGYKLILVNVMDPDNQVVALQTVVTERP